MDGIREAPARTKKRSAPWPLERAQLALRHEAALLDERDRADRAIAAARVETMRARERALEDLGRWHAENGNLVKYVYDRTNRALAEKVGPEIARRISDAWLEMEPHERVKRQLRDVMLSKMSSEIRADETTSITRLTIPPIEYHYATNFSGFDGFPWRDTFGR